MTQKNRKILPGITVALAVTALLAFALFLTSCDPGPSPGNDVERYPPSPPSFVTAKGISTTEIQITWEAVPRATGYIVESGRESSFGGSIFWSIIAGRGDVPIPGTSLNHTGLAENSTHWYRIIAVNNAGSGSRSIAVSSQPLPTPPTNVRVPGTTSNQIDIRWDSVAGATGYRIERATAATGPWNNISHIHGRHSTMFLDTGLSPNTTMFYRVITINNGGESIPSATISGTTRSL